MSDCATILESVDFGAGSEYDNSDDTELPLSAFTVLPVEFASQSSQEQAVNRSRTLLAEACDSQSPAQSEFTERFSILLEESAFEYGFSTPAEQYVNRALEKYGTFARDWIMSLFYDRFKEGTSDVCNILRVIAHFDYDQMSKQGAIMATAALLHKDSEVRECGVRCFENWEESSCIGILQNCRFNEDWLKEYLEQVISDLEGA